MAFEISKSLTNSAESNIANVEGEAPMTLRMPISLVLRSALNADRPNKPRQAIKMASAAKVMNTWPNRSSDR